ncbi:DUF3709 domain-containing protein [Epilithonimonas hispanica]
MIFFDVQLCALKTQSYSLINLLCLCVTSNPLIISSEKTIFETNS